MIGIQMIVGQNAEPFLEAALQSVAWADYVCLVNTDPDGMGGENEAKARRVVPREKLRVAHLRMHPFDFARARMAALELATPGDQVLIVDADDVHWPEFEGTCRKWAFEMSDLDVGMAHFWHHCVYKDLWHSEPHRELFFTYTGAQSFENTMGGVHEELRGIGAGGHRLMAEDYHYHHYGYIKPSRDVARRWEFYRSLGAEIHDYDVSQPDRALDDWPRVCKMFTGEHPPAVRPALDDWPSSPAGLWPKRPGRPAVGLVMLTWDDGELLPQALRTLANTTQPHRVVFVDNGSTDNTVAQIKAYQQRHPESLLITPPEGGGWSLAVALNLGFDALVTMEQPPSYVGWVHPDHRFEWPDWLEVLVREMDANPGWAKLGASEANEPAEERAGNSQCYIVRLSAMEGAGLFDEAYEACGGYEDWDHNRRLLEYGEVLISGEARVRHLAMSTRKRHDNVEAAKRNADHYHATWGTWEAAV